jgi:hypothetical protein
MNIYEDNQQWAIHMKPYQNMTYSKSKENTLEDIKFLFVNFCYKTNIYYDQFCLKLKTKQDS